MAPSFKLWSKLLIDETPCKPKLEENQQKNFGHNGGQKTSTHCGRDINTHLSHQHLNLVLLRMRFGKLKMNKLQGTDEQHLKKNLVTIFKLSSKLLIRL
jgi:hypothetical protein